MYVVIRIFGRVGLHNEMHVFKIYSSGDNICSKEDPVGLLKELFDNSLSSASFEFSMNSVDVIFTFKVASEHLEVEIDACAGAQKDDDLRIGHLLLQKIY